MKTTLIVLCVMLVAGVAVAQTVIYAPPAAPAPQAGYTYYNTVNPNTGNSTTGYVYTQPTSPTTGYQYDTTTGQQTYYQTNGDSTVMIPLTSK